ncbi:plasmid mobilization relaxosome protein MobC [Levilactobacillus brevis]
MILELTRQGTNLNQIARKLNQAHTCTIYEAGLIAQWQIPL